MFKDPVVEQLGLLPSIRRVYSGEVVHLPQVHIPGGLVATHYSPARNDQVIQSVTMFPLLTETGEIQQVVTIWQDMTERVRAQETSCQAEARYRNLIETATDAIIAAEGDKITLWNMAAETMFGYSAVEAIGQPLMLIIPETHRKQHIQGLTHFFKTTGSEAIGHIYEVEGLRKDGLQFPVEISVAAQKLEERYRFTAVLRDITARRQAEATLAALNAAALAAQQARTPDEVYAAMGDALRDLGLSLVVVAPDPTDEHLVIRYAVLQADQARVLEKALGQAVQRIKFPLASLPAYSTYWQSGQAEFRRDLLAYIKGRAARKLARAGLKALGNPACIDAPFTDESGVTVEYSPWTESPQ